MVDEGPIWLQSPRNAFEIVVIGASAGGMRALQMILEALGPGFPAAILLAHHRGPGSIDPYRRILCRSTSLHVVEAANGEALVPGTLYLAPDSRHLELDGAGRLDTQRSERYATVRPSADLLFQSVAACYGDRAVAVVLTGFGRDGAIGVCAIRQCGGFVIAQDRRSAEHLGMPASAIETRRVDLVLPLRHIGFALGALFQN